MDDSTPNDESQGSGQNDETHHDPPPPLVSAESDSQAGRSLGEAWAQKNRDYLFNLPWERYQQPPLLAPLWGYDQQHFRGKTAGNLIFWTRMAGRRFDDAEKDIILHATTRAVAGSMYDRPIAASVTAYFMHRSWVKTAPERGFPFDARVALKRVARVSFVQTLGWVAYWYGSQYLERRFIARGTLTAVVHDPRLKQAAVDMIPEMKRLGLIDEAIDKK